MISIGVDIGSSSIKVVELSSNNKGVQITRFFEHSLGTNPAYDTELEIIEFLKTLSSTYDQPGVRFVLSLKQELVSVRNKIFPFHDRQKILKSLPFELEEDLPFSSETAIYDSKIVRQIGSTAEVLACATPKRRVEKALQLATDTGIDLSILSCEGIAYANCFERWDDPIPVLPPQLMELDLPPEGREISIHVVLGHTHTLVCAVENHLLIGVRSILWGGKNIAEAIVKKYEIPYVEALKEMQTKAFILPNKEGASYDQIVFSDTISNSVKELAQELKISILEFKSEFNGHVLSVGLTGGSSSILNLHAFLTQQLELPVNSMSVTKNFPHATFEITADIESKIGIALGLAIEGLKKPRNPALNFMRGEFAKQNTSLRLFWERWGPSLQVAAAFLVIFLAYSMARETLSLSLADRTSEVLKSQAKTVARLPLKSQNESGVKKYIREQKKRALEMKTLSGIAHMNSALDVLKKINDAVPGKNIVSLDVRKLTVLENQVQIQGTVSDARQLASLEAALASVALGKLSKLTVTPGGKPGVPFAYSFQVDREIQAETK
ncbi:MAG: pilus assembly protein PilM [Bdellovibrio sp. CG10_big_fil_rev_8_21_14_0_10_47_8]|nr:MAG: pilus assembly protein PilM [Bdellovibrio sp. CG10_big_fil_rev_8_21_14_0_10_47_8]